MPYTCSCGRKFDLAAALNALPPDGMGSSAMLVPKCAGCGESIEMRLRSGSFDVGYSYWGGSMHFETIAKIRVPKLRITPSDPDDLEVVLGDRHWHFGIRQLSHRRFVIFAQAFANGRRLGDIDFAQWNVIVTGVDRAEQAIAASPELVLAAGDFVHLAGPEPALVRAWHYLNDGKSRNRIRK